MSRRIAVLSDVHGNLVALEAVLDEVSRLDVDEIVVAGDLSGFGADPDGVTDRLRDLGAMMIRGNHEKDYVAVYDSPAIPDEWLTSERLGALRWNMERLGPERRAFLGSLPDRLLVDDLTLVVHGSPRHVRDSVMDHTPVEELAAWYEGESCRTAFCGHTHRPVVRDLPDGRRLVNAGSVGLPLGGDTRATFAIADMADGPGCWHVDLRRVAYDVEAAIAAHRDGLETLWPEFVEVYARTLRTGRDHLGPLLKATRDVADADFREAARAHLARSR